MYTISLPPPLPAPHSPPNPLPTHIQRHRRQHQRRLDPRHGVKSPRGPLIVQPNRQKLPRGKRKEIPHHDHEDGRLDADTAVRVEQVCETGRLLRNSREDDGTVEEGDEHPACVFVLLGTRRVPAEEG